MQNASFDKKEKSVCISSSPFWAIHRVASYINREFYKLPEDQLFMELGKLDPLIDPTSQSIVHVKDRNTNSPLFVCHYSPDYHSKNSPKEKLTYPIIKKYVDGEMAIVCYDVVHFNSIYDLVVSSSKIGDISELKNSVCFLENVFYRMGKDLGKSHKEYIENSRDNGSFSSRTLKFGTSKMNALFAEVVKNDCLVPSTPFISLAHTYVDRRNSSVHYIPGCRPTYSYQAECILKVTLSCKIMQQSLPQMKDFIEIYIKAFLKGYEKTILTRVPSKGSMLLFNLHFWTSTLKNLKTSCLYSVSSNIERFLTEECNQSFKELKKYLS